VNGGASPLHFKGNNVKRNELLGIGLQPAPKNNLADFRSFQVRFSDETAKQQKQLIHDGSITSVYSRTVQDPKTGKWYNVPGFDREKRKIINDDQALNTYLPDIRAGRFRGFNSVDEAVKTVVTEHQSMDAADNESIMRNLMMQRTMQGLDPNTGLLKK